MASKRTVPRKGSHKRRQAETPLELSRHAKAEVAELLRRSKAGTITRVQLQTGLEKVKRRLRLLLPFMHRIV
jgi:hypothetical protein